MHTHSTASDGQYTPEQLINLAHILNIDEYVLSDHDTISGLAAAAQTAKGKIHFIPGIELSTRYYGLSIHILGININYSNTGLESALKPIQDSRTECTRKVVNYQHKKGKWKFIDFEELKSDIAENYPYNTYISSAHVAMALFQKSNEFKSVYDALQNFEGTQILAGIRNEYYLSLDEGVDIIMKYEGAIAIPHINKLQKSEDDEERLIRELLDKEWPLSLEVVSPVYADQQIIRYLRLIKRYSGLTITAGSDFHGDDIKPGIQLGINLETILTPEILTAADISMDEVKSRLLLHLL